MACSLCDDTGWKSIEINGVSRVARCDCVRDSLPPGCLPTRGFHDVISIAISPTTSPTTSSSPRPSITPGDWPRGFPVVDKGLFLQGPPGVGKTHLVVAVLRQVILTRGARGLFYDTRDLLQ